MPHGWTAPSDVKVPGRYVFETTPESKGDRINREIEIVELNGVLGVVMRAGHNFVKVKDFRKDCRLRLL